MTLMDHVARYVSLKRRLGYDYRTHAGILRQYARFADDRGDRVVRTATVTEWASAAVSRHQAAGGCTSCTPSRCGCMPRMPPRAPAKGLLRPSFQSAPAAGPDHDAGAARAPRRGPVPRTHGDDVAAHLALHAGSDRLDRDQAV